MSCGLCGGCGGGRVEQEMVYSFVQMLLLVMVGNVGILLSLKYTGHHKVDVQVQTLITHVPYKVEESCMMIFSGQLFRFCI